MPDSGPHAGQRVAVVSSSRVAFRFRPNWTSFLPLQQPPNVAHFVSSLTSAVVGIVAEGMSHISYMIDPLSKSSGINKN